MRFFRGVIVFFVIALFLQSGGTLRAAPALFDLPEQPADAALLAFSKQAKVEVLFSFDELHAVRSTAVSGTFEPEEALNRLLRGTGFIARRNGPGKFVVSRPGPPAGAIRGRLIGADGAPAKGVRIGILETRQSVAANDNGEFYFSMVQPGRWQLFASGDGYQPMKILDAQVEAGRVLALETLVLQPAGEAGRLEPMIVEAHSEGAAPFDRSRVTFPPRTAVGNLDLQRTENDVLPFTIYDRDQITHSGAVNLNEFLQRELLESDPSAQAGSSSGVGGLFAGSTNLNLRGFDPDETVILVNGRRLPEALTNGDLSVAPRSRAPDVDFIPLSLVQQIQVLPMSASALYSGDPVGGVINIVLRPDVEANATEVTTTYKNATKGYDAPQSSVSLVHGQTFLDGALRVRLNANLTRTVPPTEAELGYRRVMLAGEPAVTEGPIYRATPNVRSGDGSPLFGPGTAAVTSVAPGANGAGGLAAFAGRQGVLSSELFDTPGGFAQGENSIDYAYGRNQRREVYYGSFVYDVLPRLQVGLDATYARTRVNPGLDVLEGDLKLKADSPFNPFGRDVQVALNETAPALGEDYDEARIDVVNTVAGLLLKLPADWKLSLDAQYDRNTTRYRGLFGTDPSRWQQLVDEGRYNPLRDTQVYGPPAEFYDRVLIFRDGLGKFVNAGRYDTVDAALRARNEALPLPTGEGKVNVGVDYRRDHLDPYRETLRFADGAATGTPAIWTGRTLQRYSLFGELQAPLVPERWRPRGLRQAEGDFGVRYVAASNDRETNFAPTAGLKLDLAGGVSLRGSVTTSNRMPTPSLGRQVIAALPDNPSGGSNLTIIRDPLRGGETYQVQSFEPVNQNLRLEEAVTQTAGLIFQRGKSHRFRASIDFVDTEKTNEQQGLDTAQLVVDLEKYYPERVSRGPAASDGLPGRINTVFTGAVNVARRHSQNWETALDYAWREVCGGTLEVYGRLVYYQRYDVKLLPNSPMVDELRDPDGAMPGLLRVRSNFGANWSNRQYGFGVDGHFFGSRLLPAVEAAAQGGDHVASFSQWDAYVQSDLSRWLPWKNSRYGLRGQVRVDNVFAASYPRDASTIAGVQPYGDWRGRVYSLSLTATF